MHPTVCWVHTQPIPNPLLPQSSPNTSTLAPPQPSHTTRACLLPPCCSTRGRHPLGTHTYTHTHKHMNTYTQTYKHTHTHPHLVVNAIMQLLHGHRGGGVGAQDLLGAADLRKQGVAPHSGFMWQRRTGRQQLPGRASRLQTSSPAWPSLLAQSSPPPTALPSHSQGAQPMPHDLCTLVPAGGCG